MAHEKTYEPHTAVSGIPGTAFSWTTSREISGSSGPWFASGVGVGGGTVQTLTEGSPWDSSGLSVGDLVTVDAAADRGSTLARVASMQVTDVSGGALDDVKTYTIADRMKPLLTPMVLPASLPSSNVDASTAITAICTKAGIAHDVQASGITVPAVIFHGARTGWEAIQAIASQTLGAVWMSETGVLTYRNAATVRGVGTPVETINSLSTAEDMPWEYSEDDVHDRVELTYSPITIETVTDNSLTLWESTELIEIAAGATVTLEQDFEGAASSLAAWRQMQDESAPMEQFSRWNASTSKDGGDAPASSALTVTSTLVTASRVRITLKNNLSQTLFVSDFGYQSLILRANKKASVGAAITFASGASEETARSPYALDVGTYAGTETQAKNLLAWLAQQSATPRAMLSSVRVVPDPARKLGSIVRVVDPITGLDSRAIITAIDMSGSFGSLAQNLTLALVSGTSPSPVTSDAVIVKPVGTSSPSSLVERQVQRDLSADRTSIVPPPAPSVPVVSVRLGVIRISYDGFTNTGGVMPSRVERVQVAFGPTSMPVTVVDTIPVVGGLAIITDQPYNTARFVRLRAVNYSGVAGPWGPEQPVTVTPLVDTDLIGQVIAEANLGNNVVTARTIVTGAVTTEKLAALSVEAGKIAANAITTDKINAGAITGVKIAADAIDGKTITGAILRTAASGQRVQIDSAGLRAFNSAGTAVTTISASTGELTATGSFRSNGEPGSGEATVMSSGWIEVAGPANTTQIKSGNIALRETSGSNQGSLQLAAQAGDAYISGHSHLTVEGTNDLSLSALRIEIRPQNSLFVRHGSQEMIGVFEDSTSQLVRFPQSYGRNYSSVSTGSTATKLAVLTSAGTLGTASGDVQVAGRLIAETTLRTIGFEETTSSASCVMTTGGWLQRSTSIRAAKAAIEDLDIDGLTITRALRPRTWHDKGSADRLADGLAREASGENIDWDEITCELGRIPGYIAEEIDELDLPAGFATKDEEGTLTGVAYDRIPTIHTLAIQQLADTIDSLTERINTLEGATQ